MTTMDERIEAAARAEYATMPYLDEEGEVIPWEDLHENVRVGRCNEMRPFIAAAFPELQGDKPRGWIAPWEATHEMAAAAAATEGMKAIDSAFVIASLHGFSIPGNAKSPLQQAFEGMRDAYLGKGGGG